MAETQNSTSPRPVVYQYRFLMIAIGSLLLLWVTVRPSSNFNPGVALIILFFVAFQINFPLKLLHNEISFIHIITLGGGLLYGATTAGWAATIGIFLGYAIRSLWKVEDLASRKYLAKPIWVQAGITMGWHNTALLTALLLTGTSAGLITSFDTQTIRQVGLTTIPPMLLYALLHAMFFNIDFSLSGWVTGLSLRRDYITLVLVELLPSPFIMVVVMAYPAIGITALVVLGAVPIIIAILMYGINAARLDQERRLKELSLLNQLSQALRSTLNLAELVSVIQAQISRLLPVDNYYIALQNQADDRIWYPLVVENGQRQDWPERAPYNSSTDLVIREMKSLMLAPSSEGEHLALDIPGKGTQSAADMNVADMDIAWIGVPLASSDRAIGCLALYSPVDKISFTHADLDLLTIIGSQISASIENALLYDQAHRRADQLETLNQISTLIVASLDPQEVLTQVCHSVSRVTDGKYCAIFLLDPDESLVWLAQSYELPSEFTSQNQSFSIAHNGRTRCLRSGQPVLTPNLDITELEQDFFVSLEGAGIQAFGDFPLITPEGQIGYLSVYYDTQHTFAVEEVELLQIYASHAALAVSNARLHARTDLALSQRAHQLSILEAVGRELAAATHSEQLFEIILNYAREFTDSPWGNLGLYNPINKLIEIKASIGYQTTPAQHTVDTGVSGRAIRTQQVINVRDVRTDPDYIDLTEGAARSQLSTPLIYEGRVLGILTLENEKIAGYTANEQAFVSQLVNQAAIVVVNAELYGETQRRLREQSILYQVSARLASIFELESVLQTVQDATEAFLVNSITGIYLWVESLNSYVLQPTPRSSSSTTTTGRLVSQTYRVEASSRLPAIITEGDLDEHAPNLLGNTPIQLSADQVGFVGLRLPENSYQAVIFPLVANQQRLGMALLLLPKETVLLGDVLQLLRAVIAQGAISLQNALLLSDVITGRDRLSAVLNSVNDGILMIEADGAITLVNEAIQEITGIAPSVLRKKRITEISTKTFDLLGFTQQELHNMMVALGRGQEMVIPKTTQKISTPQGDRFLERSSLPVLGGQDGGVVGWMLVFRDVTHEQEVTQARELITETLVHDLRSPLSAVMGAIDVVDENLAEGQDPIISQALGLARRGTTRVLSLVESMLDISRMQSGTMELSLKQVDLYALATTVLGDFLPRAIEYGVLLRNEIPADIPQVEADSDLIGRVLTNLVDNALKFTPTGEQVLVTAEPYPDNMLAIRVLDRGPGIPKNYREQIFERFTQIPDQHGRKRGTGLGLTFCRLSIEAHGGRIWVEPRDGKGSKFSFTLPIVGPDSGK